MLPAEETWVEGDSGLKVGAGRESLPWPRMPVGREQVAKNPSEGGKVGGLGNIHVS